MRTGSVVYWGSQTHKSAASSGKAAALKARMAAHVRIIIERKVAPKIGKELIAILKDTLRSQKSNKTKRKDRKLSVWTKIADSLYVQYRMRGKKTEIIVSCKHPAAALKQWGGFIKAGGPWSEPSPYHNNISKFIPIQLPAAPGRLGLQKNLKFKRGLYQTWSKDEPDDDRRSYDPTRLHMMPLSRLLRPSKAALKEWMKDFAPIRARLGGIAKAQGDAKFKQFKILRDVAIAGGAVTREGQWLEAHDDIRITTQYGDTITPPRPAGVGGDILTRWISRVGKALIKQYGYSTEAKRRKATKQFVKAKHAFMTQTRLVFTMQSRKEKTMLYMLVPSWFIPAANGGKGWIPTKNDMRASLLKRLKEGSKAWLAIQKLR